MRTPWLARRAAGGLLILVIALALVGVWRSRSGPVLAQPLRFNHAAHVKEAKCPKCHRTVNTAERAGVPTTKNCASCHKGDPLSQDPRDVEEEKRFEATYIEREAEIAWIRLYRVPSHTFFPHQVHVAAKVECETCHGPIPKGELLPVKALLPITMQGCTECHARQNVDNDCLACHR